MLTLQKPVYFTRVRPKAIKAAHFLKLGHCHFLIALRMYKKFHHILCCPPVPELLQEKASSTDRPSSHQLSQV